MSVPIETPNRHHGSTAKPECVDAPRLALGVRLVDAGGRVVAADGTADDAWLDHPPVRAAIEQVLDGVAELTIEIHARDLSADQPACQARVRRLISDDGSLALVELLADSPQAAPQRLDPLTQLPDRRAVRNCIDAWQRIAGTPNVGFAVLFLDLDDYKQINDQYGHAAGDDTLTTLASRWLACVREGDLVARYGGDEFVILLKGASTPEEIVPVMERLRDATRQPLDVGGASARVSVSIGVAICDSAEQPVDALIAAADRDMYARKRAARS